MTRWSKWLLNAQRRQTSQSTFSHLLEHIPFDDKDTHTPRQGRDKFTHIREVWDTLQANLSRHYHPWGKHNYRWATCVVSRPVPICGNTSRVNQTNMVLRYFRHGTARTITTGRSSIPGTRANRTLSCNTKQCSLWDVHCHHIDRRLQREWEKHHLCQLLHQPWPGWDTGEG